MNLYVQQGGDSALLWITFNTITISFSITLNTFLMQFTIKICFLTTCRQTSYAVFKHSSPNFIGNFSQFVFLFQQDYYLIFIKLKSYYPQTILLRFPGIIYLRIWSCMQLQEREIAVCSWSATWFYDHISDLNSRLIDLLQK